MLVAMLNTKLRVWSARNIARNIMGFVLGLLVNTLVKFIQLHLRQNNRTLFALDLYV